MINKKKIKDIIKKSLMIDVVISLLFIVVNPLNFSILEQIFFIFYIISLGIILNFSDYIKPIIKNISVIVIFLIVLLFVFSGISYGHSNIQEKEKMSISPFIQNSFNPIENVNYSLLSGYTDINIQNGYIQYYYSGNTTSIFQNIITGKLISHNTAKYQGFIYNNNLYWLSTNGLITYFNLSTSKTYQISNSLFYTPQAPINPIVGLPAISIFSHYIIYGMNSGYQVGAYTNYFSEFYIYNILTNTTYGTSGEALGGADNTNAYIYNTYIDVNGNYALNFNNMNNYYNIASQSINTTSIFLSNYTSIYTIPHYGYSVTSNSVFNINENPYYYNTLNEIGVNQNLFYNHGKFYFDNITYNSSYIPDNLQYQSFYFQNGYIYFVDNGNLMSFQVNQFSIQVKSYSSIGTEINNYFLYNGNIYTKEYLNNTINIRILPLNYSVYYWTNGYIYINQSNPSFHSGIFYSYIVSIYYSQSQSAPQSPFSISTYIYPISMLFFFFMCSILIIGYIKYGSGKNGK